MFKKKNYEEKIFQIQSLINQNDLNQALKLLDEELNWSYIPPQYFAIFTKLFLQISNEKKSQINNSQFVDLETFVNALNSNDYFKLAIALNTMPKLNLHSISSIIKGWIENEKFDFPIAKIYIIEQMAEQNIDLNIKFKNQKINPKKFGSIFSKPNVIKVFQNIERLTHKNPYLTKLVFHNFKAYLLTNYPKTNYPKFLSEILIKITKFLLKKDIKLNKTELKILNQINNLRK